MRAWMTAVLLLACGAACGATASGVDDGGSLGDGGGRDAARARDAAADGEVDEDGGAPRDGGEPVDGGAPRDGGEPPRDAGPLRCAPPERPAADLYVAPDGRPTAAGTREDPLDLATALSSAGPVRPGHRVEVAGGTYVGRFASRVSGTMAAPIVIAAAPGARVTLDGNVAGSGSVLLFEGSWVELHGLELTCSGPSADRCGDGAEIYARNSKLVNCAIHDTSQGIGFWSTAVDSELYGNIIYNNGFEGPTRGHGHAIYTQNATGTKRIARNVMFFGYGYGVHAYTEGGSIRGFDFVENVWFRAGASRPGSSTMGTSDGFQIGGLTPVARARIVANESFGPTVGARSMQLGWGGSVMNEDITLLDNYIVGRVAANGMWASGTLEGNVFHSSLSGVDPADYPANEWRSSLPTGKRVVVWANAHDTTRADLVLYDWDESGSVTFDADDFLPVGASYEIFSVYDLWGSPVASGTYEGGALSVPMGAKPPPQPLNAASGITGADDPGRAFGVFVLRSTCAIGTPTTPARAGR